MLGPKGLGPSSAPAFDDTLMPRLMECILARTRQILSEEAGIGVTHVSTVTRGLDSLHIQGLTVLAGLGAPVNVLVAFSFAETLLKELVDGMVGSLGLPMEDRETYRRDCAAEAVNMALGLGTGDLQLADTTISLSTPVILDNTKWIQQHRDAIFSIMHLTTEKGVLDVSVVGPRAVFDDQVKHAAQDQVMAPLRVLVVDDSIFTVEKITSILTDLGHTVIGTAATGAGAVTSYRQLTPDLVTMDITMPDMDGVEATHLIVSEFPDAAIVMVTSHGQERLVFNALDAGAKGYVLKPIKRDKLAAVIERARTRGES
ncbi:response regulator [uncultured Rhodospira sp.]|uniref:response regulator n=1 Tax=uncultured Rhodospira sp. TaxID=1936189 RepID=UPI002613C344|nr:response regulator [uncultured Rhodospira sp.]